MKNIIKAFFPMLLSAVITFGIVILHNFKLIPDINKLLGLDDLVGVTSDFAIAVIGLYISLIAIMAALEKSSIMK